MARSRLTSSGVHETWRCTVPNVMAPAISPLTLSGIDAADLTPRCRRYSFSVTASSGRSSKREARERSPRKTCLNQYCICWRSGGRGICEAGTLPPVGDAHSGAIVRQFHQRHAVHLEERAHASEAVRHVRVDAFLRNGDERSRKVEQEPLELNALPGRLRRLRSLRDVANAYHQLLRSSNLTLSDRHLARKLPTSGSESPPDGPHPDIGNLRGALTPAVHARSVSCMETRSYEAFERGAYRILFRAPEQAFGGGIEQADSSAIVNDDDRIRRHPGNGRESLPGLRQSVFGRIIERTPARTTPHRFHGKTWRPSVRFI